MFSAVSWSFAHYQQPWCSTHHSIALFDFQDLCKPCSGSTCQFLGFNADRSSARGVFHLRTKAAKPYCISWAMANREGYWKHTFHIQIYDGASVKAEKNISPSFFQKQQKKKIFFFLHRFSILNFFFWCFGKWKNGGEKFFKFFSAVFGKTVEKKILIFFLPSHLHHRNDHL